MSPRLPPREHRQAYDAGDPPGKPRGGWPDPPPDEENSRPARRKPPPPAPMPNPLAKARMKLPHPNRTCPADGRVELDGRLLEIGCARRRDLAQDERMAADRSVHAKSATRRACRTTHAPAHRGRHALPAWAPVPEIRAGGSSRAGRGTVRPPTTPCRRRAPPARSGIPAEVPGGTSAAAGRSANDIAEAPSRAPAMPPARSRQHRHAPSRADPRS